MTSRDGSIAQPRSYYQSQAFRDALRRARVPLPAQLLFQEITRTCGHHPYSWAPTEVFARILGRSERTIRRYIDALVEAGALSTAVQRICGVGWRGGSRRVLVPHVMREGRLVPPKGVLEGPGVLLDGVVRVIKSSLENVRGRASRAWAAVSALRARGYDSSERERKRREPWHRETLRTPMPGDCLQAVREARTGRSKALARLWRASRLWFMTLEGVWERAGEAVQASDRALWARMEALPLGEPPAWWLERREVLLGR